MECNVNDSIEEILEKACELHFLSLEDVRGDTAIVRYEDDVYSVDISGKDFNVLSMGMSGDFEVAIEEGANLVRIGQALFGNSESG